jgi:phosphoribosylglycinamide formyltransferase 1
LNRLVVLASGSGSNLQALLDAGARGALDAEVAAVVSERPDAGALRRATAAGIPAICLPLRERLNEAARRAYDGRLARVVGAFDPDLVVLAGWMLLLSDAFLDRFPARIVNVHPALLPDDGGAVVATSRGELPALRGGHAVRDALRLGLPVTGATVHLVTLACDAGPVLARAEAPILAGDDEARLHDRIKAIEHRLLPAAVGRLLAERRAAGCACGAAELAIGGVDR